MGVQELLVFDPLLLGPKALGGPVAFQLWSRDESGAFARVHFGNQPVYSNVLDAWFLVVGRDLHVADDRAGSRRWPTEAEAARHLGRAELTQAQAEAERAQAEAERAQAEAERAQAEAEREKAHAQREQELREQYERRVAALSTR
jgi:uncharacterized membrane protein YccC